MSEIMMLCQSCTKKNLPDKRKSMRIVSKDGPEQSKRRCLDTLPESNEDNFEINPFTVFSSEHEGLSIDIHVCDFFLDNVGDNFKSSNSVLSNIDVSPTRPVSPCSYDDLDIIKILLADDEPLDFDDSGGDDNASMEDADDIIDLIDALVSINPPFISSELKSTPSQSCEVQLVQHDDNHIFGMIGSDSIDPIDFKDFDMDNSIDDGLLELISCKQF
mmetsp:Transcript_21563/g.44497  ORF Transcript_21563/g.44497 Transcript_21563/m.44497 type:complete len:217 (-) Transcript_21563:1528-2178(-)